MIGRMLDAFERGRDETLLRWLTPGGETPYTGRALLSDAGSWQGVLAERNVRPGDRVALEVPRGPGLLAAHAAVLAWGATVVPVNPALSEGERARLLERADVATRLRGEEARPGSGPLRLREPPTDAPALLVFTSGTTGEPKGVPLTRANLEANLGALEQAWGLSGSDRLLHVLPAHHVHGLVLALYGSARLGIPVFLMDRFDADRALAAIDRLGITLFMGVPTMYRRMTRSPNRGGLESMRLFVSGSAPLPPADLHEFEARFGHRPLERYGLTETMIVTSNPLDGERRPGTVGLPLRETTVRLAGDGEIEVRGPAVMSGYWRAETTGPQWSADRFFRTGDLGSLDERGYLAIRGRKKELILVGGSNVIPGEVERALADGSSVEELAALGQPDPDLGEVVTVVVVARSGADPGEVERELRDRAERELAPYKRPRSYRFVDALPRNSMGKVDRRALARASD